MTPVLELTIDLCRRASVTPEDAGCQDLIAQRLQAAGFKLARQDFGKVRNLLAWHGHGDPSLLFLGHTDVVPPGPLEGWQSPPFEPSVREGMLYARGAADMKGSVAAMVLALEDFAARHREHPGRIGILLTSDEEGPAIDGVRRVADAFARSAERVTWCLVGEPSSKTDLGDVVRVGRRGSLGARVLVRGVQGHVAFPEIALNPIHAAAPALAELAQARWDRGTAQFPPTTFQVSNIRSGTGALNVIPGELEFDCNFRFCPASSTESLMQRLEAVLARHELDYRVDWELSGAPYYTPPGRLFAAVSAAVRERLGIEPQPNTGGGTSDGRFIAALGSEVLEFGPVNASIHKLNEHVRTADLDHLREIYLGTAERLLGGDA
jgi:succinyl-diaminopimelate desuccinylase